MKLFIYPYASGSESAKLLADRLGAKRIRLQNSEYVHKEDHLVINWGNSNCPYPCLNPGDALRNTVDKLRLFRLFKRSGADSCIPEYWTDAEDIPDSAFPVFVRETTSGCDGAGTSVAHNRSQLRPAPLYTRAITGGKEYRVTFFKDYGITDIQTKLPRVGEEQNDYIKTYSNGWGFQRKPVDDYLQEDFTTFCEDVVRITGLDFFGLDVIVNEEQITLLEVNSAMGLEGGALDRFATAIEAYVNRIEPIAETPEALPKTIEFTVGTPRDYDEQDFLLAMRTGRWTDVITMAVSKL